MIYNYENAANEPYWRVKQSIQAGGLLVLVSAELPFHRLTRELVKYIFLQRATYLL